METILVVDDDKLNLQMAQTILKDQYRVSAVNSGEMAFKALERIKPDLILLDINMPDMDGFEVIERLKSSIDYQEIPVVFLTAEKSDDVEAHCFKAGAEDYVSKPFVPEVLISRVRRIISLKKYQANLENMVEQQADKLLEQARNINRMQREVIKSMANLIESRDNNTGNHVKRTSEYVGRIIVYLQNENIYSEILTSDYVSNLLNAAPMHDVGKIKVPDSILQKPGKLTSEEFEIMKSHSAEGGLIIDEILRGIESDDYVEIARDVATYHHEKWDGSGYPSGKKNVEIPLSARIMAVADVFDALVSKRCYKEALSYDKAKQIIEESKATHFDPFIAQAVLDNWDDFIRPVE